MSITRKAGPTIGCLMIEDFLKEDSISEDFSAGGPSLSGLCAFLREAGICTEVFRWTGRGDIHTCLQEAYHNMRSRCATACIAADGSGILGAVALGAQLPVERMVLMDGGYKTGEASAKLKSGIRRLGRYVRRSAAFCVADVLMVPNPCGKRGMWFQEIGRQLVNCRIESAAYCGPNNHNICTNGEHFTEKQISGFLLNGEYPKYHAQNSEMCIIYE